MPLSADTRLYTIKWMSVPNQQNLVETWIVPPLGNANHRFEEWVWPFFSCQNVAHTTLDTAIYVDGGAKRILMVGFTQEFSGANTQTQTW
jgi:hypothetical protein